MHQLLYSCIIITITSNFSIILLYNIILIQSFAINIESNEKLWICNLRIKSIHWEWEPMVQKQNKSLYPVVSMWGQVRPTMSRRTSIFSLSRLFSSASSWFCLRSFITSLWLAPPAPLSAISKIFLDNQMHQYWICKNLRKNSSKT